MQEKGPFSMFTVHVESKWVLCLHVCIYLSAIRQCGWPETGQRLWFQSRDVRHLNVFYVFIYLNTPPSLWCRLIIRVARRARVFGGHLFFPIPPPTLPPSLPPSLLERVAVRESAKFREEEVQLSVVLAFISFPLRITVSPSNPLHNNLKATLASEAHTEGSVAYEAPVSAPSMTECNVTQTVVYLNTSSCAKFKGRARNCRVFSRLWCWKELQWIFQPLSYAGWFVKWSKSG